MPEIGTVTIEPVSLPAIPAIPPIGALPDAPPVTLELGVPVVQMPGCVPVHPDVKLNPGLLQDDPGRVGMFCPDGQIPHFTPLDYTPAEYVPIQQEKPQRGDDSKDQESKAPERPTIPKLPESNAPTPKAETAVPAEKPLIEKAIDGLPPIEAVVTTTTIAVVATTSALVAKPLADLVLKLIKPTVKKVLKKVSQVRGKPVRVDSLLERRLAQRDRNRAVRALRRALKP